MVITLMNEVLKKVKNKTKKLHVCFDKMIPVYISEYLFAYDIGYYTENETIFGTEHINIITGKTKIMKIG